MNFDTPEYMSRSLKSDIQLKLDKINEDPAYYLAREHQIKAALRRENKAFSWWIEHPDIHRRLLRNITKVLRGNLIQRARKGIEHLADAWKYLAPSQDPFQAYSLHRVAELVDPYENKHGYRNGRVTMGFSEYVPPNPLKVSELVDEALTEVRKSNVSSVERAATLHLRLAGIQPFPSGNKRVARLYQDKVLYDSNLPPALIPAGEREIYIDLLEKGLVSLRDNNQEGRQFFFDYIGGKVNSALDKILHDIKVK